jgi:hypothetical protein
MFENDYENLLSELDRSPRRGGEGPFGWNGTFQRETQRNTSMNVHNRFVRNWVGAHDHGAAARTRGLPVKLWALLLPLQLLLSSFSANAAPLMINGVGGYTVPGLVVKGRWTGQPMPNPRSNAYKGYLAVESNYDATWEITGKNFGAMQGSVQLIDEVTMQPLKNVSLVINRWTDDKITVTPKATYKFTFAKKVLIFVSRVKNPPLVCSDATSLWKDNLVGIIQTRGFGQCTWQVAKIRLDNSLPIPPTAYTVSGSVGVKAYTPQRFDCLNYGGRHVGIITSVPKKITNKDGSVTWQFNVTEMNARADEKESVFSATFTVRDAGTTRTVVKGISCNAGLTATGYYR